MYQRSTLPGLLAGVTFVLGLLANVGSVQAVPLFGGSNLLSDDSAEILRNADGTTCGIAAGTWHVSDEDLACRRRVDIDAFEPSSPLMDQAQA